MPWRMTNLCLVPIVGVATACAPQPIGRAKVAPSVAAPPQAIPAPTRVEAAEVREHHFAQALGVDAPFQAVELFVSYQDSNPRQRLLLTPRPDAAGTKRPVEITGSALCLERVEGATTTFHVQADTPAGLLDWRFEWPPRAPEPSHLQHALLLMIGLYAEPAKPIAVGPADR